MILSLSTTEDTEDAEEILMFFSVSSVSSVVASWSAEYYRRCADGCAADDALQTKFAASSVLPVPL
jgi:hypothetical protein